MSERLNLIKFSFVCPFGREEESKKILDSTEIVPISISNTQDARLSLPEFKNARGFEVTAYCLRDSMERVSEALSKAKIAGFSKNTKIIFLDDPDYY